MLYKLYLLLSNRRINVLRTLLRISVGLAILSLIMDTAEMTIAKWMLVLSCMIAIIVGGASLLAIVLDQKYAPPVMLKRKNSAQEGDK